MGYISFRDEVATDEAGVIARRVGTSIALGLTLRDNGDMEVAMPPEACERLIALLQQLLLEARNESARHEGEAH